MKRIYFICLLLCLTTLAVRPSLAQTEAVLYSFCSEPNCTDGRGPSSRLTPHGNGGWNETVLYSFCSVGANCTDGSLPFFNVIFDSVGNLYGVAQSGAYNYGVVWELSPLGENWTETVLYNFKNNADGGDPISGVIMDSVGNLYGSNLTGGVFELSPLGGGWTEQVIYNVDGGKGLTMDAAGNIFGATLWNVFELSPNGHGGWNPTVIYTSPSNYDLTGTLTLDQVGNLYGTAISTGRILHVTVYELSLVTKGKNKGKWKRTVLYSFEIGKHRLENYSYAGVLLDAAGNIYGTILNGGEYNDGMVFELVAPVGKGSYAPKILWSFNGTDGSWPEDQLILDAGNLYGTTTLGGSSGYGVLFEVAP